MVDFLFPIDDAYIVQHIVSSLLDGGDGRYLSANPLVGATSPAFVFLILAFAYVLPVEIAQLLVVLAAAILYGWGAYRLSRVFGIRPWLASLVVVFSFGFGHSIYQLLNGLETGLAMAAVIWTCIFFRNGFPEKSWHFSLLGVLPFIRPELGVLSLTFFSYALISIREKENSNSQAVRGAAYSMMGAVPILLLLYLNTSTLMPNTVGAKVYFFAEGCLPLSIKASVVAHAFSTYALFAGVGSLGVIGLLFSRLRWVSGIFIFVFIVAYVTRFPGALYHNHFRYMHLLFPFVVVGWIAVLSIGIPIVRFAARGFFFVALGMMAFSVPVALADYRAGLYISQVELRGVAEWVSENVPEASTVLIHDAGVISLIGRQSLVDLVGLKTPTSISVHKDYTWQACGRVPEAIEKIALDNGAQYFVVLNEWDAIFSLTNSLRYLGWTVERIDEARGTSRYNVYRIAPKPNVEGDASPKPM